MAYVISIDGKPLMPCAPAKARHLMEQGKAVRRKSSTRDVFVIQLTFVVDGHVDPVTLGVDAGYKTIGLSASSETTEHYSAEIELREDISGNLKARSDARRGRRSRKTRHRKPRFSNRGRPEGWLPPSVEARVQAHVRAIDCVCRILPVSEIRIEVASFDIQKLKNPDIEGEGYQQGERMGFWNLREYILHRDNHTCQACKGKSKDDILEVHHIIPRDDGGTDRPGNLVTLCSKCHHEHHNGKPRKLPKPSDGFKAETFMGISRWTILRRVREAHPDKAVSPTWGYVTKSVRINAGLEKSHRTDALCMAGHPGAKRAESWVAGKKVRCHNRQVHKSNTLKGGRKKLNQAPREVFGFRLFDKVRFKGVACFVTGRRSSGYFALKTLDGTKVHDSAKHKELRLLERSKSILTERRRGDSSAGMKPAVSSPKIL